MPQTRIPKLTSNSPQAAKSWLRRMHARDLLFCLDDNPSDIQKIDSDLPTFTADECAEVTAIVSRLFETHGDMIHEFAFDVVSLTFHTRQERAAIKLMYG